MTRIEKRQNTITYHLLQITKITARRLKNGFNKGANQTQKFINALNKRRINNKRRKYQNYLNKIKEIH